METSKLPPPPGLGFTAPQRLILARHTWTLLAGCKVFVTDGNIMCKFRDSSLATIPAPQKVAAVVDVAQNSDTLALLDEAGLLTIIGWKANEKGVPEFKTLQQEPGTALDQIHLCKRSPALYGSTGRSRLVKFADPRASLHNPEASNLEESYLVWDATYRAIYTLAEDYSSTESLPRIIICANLSASVGQQVYLKVDLQDQPEDLCYLGAIKSVLTVSAAGAKVVSLVNFSEITAKFPFGPHPILASRKSADNTDTVTGCIAGRSVYLIAHNGSGVKINKLMDLGETKESSQSQPLLESELKQDGKTVKISLHFLEAPSQFHEFPIASPTESKEPAPKSPEEKKEPPIQQQQPQTQTVVPAPEPAIVVPEKPKATSLPAEPESKKEEVMPEILKMLSSPEPQAIEPLPAKKEETKVPPPSPSAPKKEETVAKSEFGTQTDEGFKTKMLEELEKRYESALFSRLERLKTRLAEEVEVRVEERVAGIVAGSIDRHMAVVKENIDRNLQKCVAKAVCPEKLQDQVNAVHERLQANLNFIMQKVFLPAFEDSCAKMTKEVAKTYAEGIRSQRQKLEADDNSIRELKRNEELNSKRNHELSEQIEAISERQLETIRKAEEIAKNKLVELRESIKKEAILAAAKAPPPEVKAVESTPYPKPPASVMLRPTRSLEAEEVKERSLPPLPPPMPTLRQTLSPAEQFEEALNSKDASRALDIATANCFKGNEFAKFLDTFPEPVLAKVATSMQPTHHAYVRYSINRMLSYLAEHKDKINAKLVGLLKKGQILLVPVQSTYQEYQAVQTTLSNFFRWMSYNAPSQ